MDLDEELNLKGTAVLQMYLTIALDTGNVEVSSRIEAILNRRGTETNEQT
jgi:hypothetical protein|tara:strand:- start:160 stop:309 length:150 start_codon:yes stop_codon:yes gene_type:complete